MRLTIIFLIFSSLLTGCAITTETGVVSGVEIIAFGIKTESNGGSDQGVQLKEATKITYRQGFEYGLKYRVLGEPEGGSVNLKVLWITTPGSATTRQARSVVDMLERRAEIGRVYYMSSSTARNGNIRRPYREKFIVGDDDGTVYAEKDFWIVDAEAD